MVITGSEDGSASLWNTQLRLMFTAGTNFKSTDTVVKKRSEKLKEIMKSKQEG